MRHSKPLEFSMATPLARFTCPCAEHQLQEEYQ